MSQQVIPVNVCGKYLEVSWQPEGPPLLQTLKESVQGGTGIRHDQIQFFDSNGTDLRTEEEVCTAISDERIPIYATMAKSVVDQFTTINLQMEHTQQELKNLRHEVAAVRQESVQSLTVMRNQLADGLEIVEAYKSSFVPMEKMVGALNESVISMGMRIGDEALKLDAAMQDMQVNMDCNNKAHHHDITRLAESLASALEMLQKADQQLGKDVSILEQKIEATRDSQNSQHQESSKKVAKTEKNATLGIDHASSELPQKAQGDVVKRVDELAKRIAAFETRIISTETLASDNARKWSASHDQLKGQYNAVLQAVEQCHLQNRTNQWRTQEVMDNIRTESQAMQAQGTAIKAEQERERTVREERLKNLIQRNIQRNLDGTLAMALTELEMKLSDRITREADDRTSSILSATDEFGTVRQEEMPSKSPSATASLKVPKSARVKIRRSFESQSSGPRSAPSSVQSTHSIPTSRSDASIPSPRVFSTPSQSPSASFRTPIQSPSASLRILSRNPSPVNSPVSSVVAANRTPQYSAALHVRADNVSPIRMTGTTGGSSMPRQNPLPASLPMVHFASIPPFPTSIAL